MADVIRVSTIDDHPLFLGGLRRALSRVAGVTVVSEGGTANDALMIAKNDAPDVLLLDIGIPGGGIEVLRCIVEEAPRVRVVMLTGSDDDNNVSQSFEAGAAGYLLKSAGLAELTEALRSVMSGRPYVTPSLGSRLLVQKMRVGSEPVKASSAATKLNFREQQVLDLMATGLTNKQIAEKLDLSVHTIKNYVTRILQKLGANNRVAAITANRNQD